ncbi:sigma-70 family RNA polymerase sigma factor [Rossellomorea vietnamensis]|uniref:RNA polymerase sigma factor n=1 Tax=Rossellomorea vietnamensis TaxID=218284 RepID=A0A5D4NTB9_9BACI|nr:sigma-70 family RNA polymerase sigma factor [Rossellomorea vietnamensis]TYS17119.1 sigma-70 family RNA polymerase sigma factor [Rossellomorea vietnamensis]
MGDAFKDNLLEEAMDDFGNEVLYIVYTYVKDYSLAEDITQEVFIKAYSKMDTFRGESSLKTWIINIAVNHCKDYFKRWETRKLLITNKINQYVKGSSKSIDSIVVEKERHSEVVEKVLELPVKYREVLILYYFEGLKLTEIAECLDTNINTVKTRLVKSKKLLSKKYPTRGEYFG